MTKNERRGNRLSLIDVSIRGEQKGGVEGVDFQRK